MGSALQTTIRDLHRRRGRERRGLALAEGVRLVEEALGAGLAVRGAAVSPTLEGSERGRALRARLEAAGVPVEPVDDRTLVALADTEHPQGVVAVVALPAWSLDGLRPPPGGAVLVLDAVQDPGNAGTLLRTAWALGAAGVIALPGTVDLANPKVLRGSMGALFRLPCVAAAPEEFAAWRAATGAALWVADMGGALPPPPGRTPVALVLGNEGAGVSAPLVTAADRIVGVPLAAGAESLNVAAAAAILLHEVVRGR